MPGRRLTVSARLRRYPALGFLAAAALLASLLPSALRVPLSGPTASAELAPVPGKSDSAPGDLSALGETSTDGLGGEESTAALGRPAVNRPGGSEDGGEQEPPAPDRGSGRNPANKRCVGNPPRQTEDPMSPPCVAFFDGDNGGATANGVTRDEIRVAFPHNCNQEGERVDKVDPNGSDPRAVLLRHYNERYQLYGRRVRLYHYQDECSSNSGTDSWYRARATRVSQAVDPFAVLTRAPASFSSRAAELRMWTDLIGGSRSTMRQGAPYLRSFMPDQEDFVDLVAEFICQKLAGRPARYHGNPLDRSRQRKFAVHMAGNTDGRSHGDQGLRRLQDRVAASCGDRAGELYVSTGVGQQIATDVARWSQEGVTTVVQFSAESWPYHTAAADSVGWRPEWLMVSEAILNGRFRTFHPATQMPNAFGLSFTPMLAERRHDWDAYRAYREACPGCPEPGANAMEEILQYYWQYLLLFRGFQAAGPRLTIENVDRGLRALPPVRSPDPRIPAAYYAPGNYSFLKDAAVVRWDVAGLPAGGRQPGCWRYVEHGKRYRAQDWQMHATDEDFDTPGWPCQGD